MKSLIVFSILVVFNFSAKAQYQLHANSKGSDYYINPIFAGDYPDPSILRVGDDYYMVHSSFEYYPGLLIWHSKDLVNWTPVTHALYKYVGSVWAPDLGKWNNKYYIYFPAGNSNYVVTADSIGGPWSDPVDLKIGGIDPFHFVDSTGNRFLYFAGGDYVPLSPDGLTVVGKPQHVYDGWPIPRSWTIEGVFMEGPKLLKHGGYYYLTVAEGGTAGPATGHMVVSARSRSPFGPWVNSPYNPIIHTKSSAEIWWSKGHGTVFNDAAGKWWMVFAGYENGHYNMGRQTLLEPVEWTKDGWYKTPDTIKTDRPIGKPAGASSKSTFSLSDSFLDNRLHPQWQFFGQYDTTRFHFTGTGLVIGGVGSSVGDCSPLLCTAPDHSYMVQVEMEMSGDATGGLVLFYNGTANTGILADGENILADLRGWQFVTEKGVTGRRVFLRLRNVDNTVDMYFSTDGQNWTKIRNSAEVSCFNHNALGGFLSLRIGLCSMGKGEVTFKDFVYKTIE